MNMEKINLSHRLKALADMVTPGNVVADIGCDHGYLSIYLVLHGICPKAIAMDVRRGPLERAVEHIQEYALEEYIETRLSNGLEKLSLGEAQTAVIAGMGGPLMESIIEAHMDLARAMKELIVQPQSELPEFRRFLRENRFVILEEELIYEDGKFYFPMRISYRPEAVVLEEEDQELYDYLGKQLICKRHSLMEAYIDWQEEMLRDIAVHLEAAGNDRADQRKGEIAKKLQLLSRARALLKQ